MTPKSSLAKTVQLMHEAGYPLQNILEDINPEAFDDRDACSLMIDICPEDEECLDMLGGKLKKFEIISQLERERLTNPRFNATPQDAKETLSNKMTRRFNRMEKQSPFSKWMNQRSNWRRNDIMWVTSAAAIAVLALGLRSSYLNAEYTRLKEDGLEFAHKIQGSEIDFHSTATNIIGKAESYNLTEEQKTELRNGVRFMKKHSSQNLAYWIEQYDIATQTESILEEELSVQENGYSGLVTTNQQDCIMDKQHSHGIDVITIHTKCLPSSKTNTHLLQTQ